LRPRREIAISTAAVARLRQGRHELRRHRQAHGLGMELEDGDGAEQPRRGKEAVGRHE
jgi:hypothetical protein